MTIAEAVPADELAFGAVAIPRSAVVSLSGREHVTVDGLLEGLQQLSRGYYDIDTEPLQLPTPENAQTAVVRAVVVVFDPESGRVLRRASGLGDANAGNVGRMVAPHLLRMAETRGIARALRHILGCGVAAVEEMGEDARETPHAPQDARSGAAPRRVAPAPVPAENGPSWPETAPAAAPVRPGFGGIRIGDRVFSRADVVSIYERRAADARRAGLASGEVDLFPLEQQPTQALADASADLKRRLEQRAAAAGAAGK